MGARFEALDEIVLMAPLDPRYTQVGFNLISVQVWLEINFYVENLNENFYAKMQSLFIFIRAAYRINHLLLSSILLML